MTVTTDRPVESPEDVADEEQRLQWEAWAASYEAFGLTDDARRVRAMNTPERRAQARAEAGLRPVKVCDDWRDAGPEPDHERETEAAAEQWDLGRDAEDPWYMDRAGNDGGAW